MTLLERISGDRRGDDRFRAHVLVAAAAMCLVLGPICAAAYHQATGSVPLVLTGLLWVPAAIAMIEAVRRGVAIRHIGAAAGLVFYATLLVFRSESGGADSPAVAGIAAIPLVLGFFCGARWASVGTALALLELVGYAALQWPFPEGSRALMQTVVAVDLSLGVLGLGWIYEVSRARSDAELDEATRLVRHGDRLATAGRLAAGVAHEINNPLQGVMGASHFLREDLEELGHDGRDVQQLLAYVDQIEAGTDRAVRVVGGLAAYAGKEMPVLAPMNAAVAVHGAAELARYVMRARGIELKLELEEELPLHGARDQLEQVVVNLLLNAADASTEGGTVTLSAAPAEGTIRLAVRDDGAGLDEATKRRVFEPFFTTKPPDRGSGLGLAICQSIITAHGGHIELDSAPNQGACFTVVLPAQAV